MKKLILVFLGSMLIVLPAKGQLNPVRNLSWSHWYEFPHNCFTLMWSKPDTSLTDTLTGYNIYRDDSLYSFTTDSSHSCSIPCWGGPPEPFCDFLNYNIGMFYIHVRAVYDKSHKESVYTDSIFAGGIYTGIKENPAIEALAISRITQENSSVLIEFNKPIEHGELVISNFLGQVLCSYILQDRKNLEIRKSDYAAGLYLLTLRTDTEQLTRKLIIK